MKADPRQIRADILLASHKSGHGHIPTCFSVVEMLCAVYETMRHDPRDPASEDRDIFILSKGHASLALYCTLARFGYFPPEKVHTFGGLHSDFGCHIDRFKVPGAEASTGSLGHGIGIATGMALAFKMRRSPRRVYALIGDGESNEGSVWESVLVAAEHRLSNLTVLYDNNKSQVRCLQIEDPAAHFKGFGCDVARVDGHDVAALAAELRKPADTVKVVVADTTKGRGCRTLVENMHAWHRRSPNADDYRQLLAELG